MALQLAYTDAKTSTPLAAAYVRVLDVTLSLLGQYATITFGVFATRAASDGGMAPLGGVQVVTLIAPAFGQTVLGAIPQGTIDSQIRTAAYGFLALLPQFQGAVAV